MKEDCFMFDFEVRIKALKIGSLRLYGRSHKPTKCLIAFTFEDFAFIFYDFTFEVNTQHISFKQHMTRLVNNQVESEPFTPLMSPVKRQQGKRIKNPVLLRMLDHYKGSGNNFM